MVINIKPLNLELMRVNSKGFTLEFWASVGDDYTRRKKVRIELEWWWMSYIVDTMKKAYFDYKSKFVNYGKKAGFEDK